MKIILFVLIILTSLIDSSRSCSIFLSLNCSCFQSEWDLSSTLPLKTYSHLYCKGISFNKKTLQAPFGVDFKNQNRFRTISLEFFLQNQVEISTNHFSSLSLLFSQTNPDVQIEITLRFNGFKQIHFHKQSLTSNMFHWKHLKKSLALHLTPTISNVNHIESIEENSTNLDEQFKFSENCFSGLILSKLDIYMHTKRDYFSSLFSFEDVFNNTNIGEVHFHGSIIPPGLPSLRRSFKGLVRSLTLHRHVDTIDSKTFPYYFPVFSYQIHSIEAHSMDLDSFLPAYNNLRGLELIKPRFEVSIDRFLPTLESLSLDIEYLNGQTLLSARHISKLKLGSRLRRLNPQVLHSLSHRLKTLDLSEIDLSEMPSDSHCYLIAFISQNYQNGIEIIFPRLQYLTECDCSRFLLLDIQLKRNMSENINPDTLCSKQCRFSDCPIISEYFQEKYSENPTDNTFKHTINDDFPSVDFGFDPREDDVIRFVKDQRPMEVMSTSTVRKGQTSGISSKDEWSEPKRKRTFSWMSLVLGIVVTLVFIVILSSIIFVIVKRRKPRHFDPVPVYV